MPEAMIVFKCDHNCFCSSLCVFCQMIFFRCFSCWKFCFFQLCWSAVPSESSLLAAQPSCFASAAHTSYLFSKNKGKLEYHITPYKTTPFFLKQLQPQARTAFQGTSNFRRMGKMCPKWSCLSEAESSGCVESPLSLVAQSRSSADYGLNGELRLIHPPISIIQEAGSIFVSQQIKTQCKTFALSTSNFHKERPLRMVPKLSLSAEMKGFFSFQTAITRELSDWDTKSGS